jgi:hypothetical protein
MVWIAKRMACWSVEDELIKLFKTTVILLLLVHWWSSWCKQVLLEARGVDGRGMRYGVSGIGPGFLECVLKVMQPKVDIWISLRAPSELNLYSAIKYRGLVTVPRRWHENWECLEKLFDSIYLFLRKFSDGSSEGTWEWEGKTAYTTSPFALVGSHWPIPVCLVAWLIQDRTIYCELLVSSITPITTSSTPLPFPFVIPESPNLALASHWHLYPSPSALLLYPITTPIALSLHQDLYHAATLFQFQHLYRPYQVQLLSSSLLPLCHTRTSIRITKKVKLWPCKVCM